MVGLAGYWLIDSNNNFYAAQYPVPQESVAVASYDSTQILSEVRIEGEDRVYNKINYSYRKNWTQYQSLPSSSTEQADFSQRQYLQALENSPSPDAEIVYQESPQLNTFFDSQTDAQFVAKRLLSIYEVQRKIYSVDLPYAIALDLGDNVSIAFGTNVVVGCIISIIDVFDGGFPVNRVQILA